jgi:hypothetical protein
MESFISLPEAAGSESPSFEFSPDALKGRPPEAELIESYYDWLDLNSTE